MIRILVISVTRCHICDIAYNFIGHRNDCHRNDILKRETNWKLIATFLLKFFEVSLLNSLRYNKQQPEYYLKIDNNSLTLRHRSDKLKISSLKSLTLFSFMKKKVTTLHKLLLQLTVILTDS